MKSGIALTIQTVSWQQLPKLNGLKNNGDASQAQNEARETQVVHAVLRAVESRLEGSIVETLQEFGCHGSTELKLLDEVCCPRHLHGAVHGNAPQWDADACRVHALFFLLSPFSRVKRHSTMLWRVATMIKMFLLSTAATTATTLSVVYLS